MKHPDQKTLPLAESSNGYYKNKKLIRTLWTGGAIYKEVDQK